MFVAVSVVVADCGFKPGTKTWHQGDVAVLVLVLVPVAAVVVWHALAVLRCCAGKDQMLYCRVVVIVVGGGVIVVMGKIPPQMHE